MGVGGRGDFRNFHQISDNEPNLTKALSQQDQGKRSKDVKRHMKDLGSALAGSTPQSHSEDLEQMTCGLCFLTSLYCSCWMAGTTVVPWSLNLCISDGPLQGYTTDLKINRPLKPVSLWSHATTIMGPLTSTHKSSLKTCSLCSPYSTKRALSGILSSTWHTSPEACCQN